MSGLLYGAAPLFSQQVAHAVPPDKAHELANVQSIRERILANRQNASGTKGYKVTIPNTTVSYDMVGVPAGEFLMGSPAVKDEQPEHKVTVTAFWMQAHEVTWDEYRLFMFANQAGEIAHKDELVDAVSRPTRPYVEMSFGMGINGFPAISMTQHAANKYAEWLSAKTGEFYRLPTEAEWEYACRAGARFVRRHRLGDYAWYAANSNGKYQKVETKKPNAWGLYDMLGNVMEWTLDQYEPYKAGDQADPWVQATAAVSDRGARRLLERSRAQPCPAPRASPPIRPGSSRIRSCRRASGMRPTPSGSASAWFVRRRFPPPKRCIATGTTASSMTSSKLALAVAVAYLARPLRNLHLYEAVEPHMGTLFRIKLYAADEHQAKLAFQSAFARITELDE